MLRREEVVDESHRLHPQNVLGLGLLRVLRLGRLRFGAKNDLQLAGSSSQALQHLVDGVELDGHLEHRAQLSKLLELVIE